MCCRAAARRQQSSGSFASHKYARVAAWLDANVIEHWSSFILRHPQMREIVFFLSFVLLRKSVARIVLQINDASFMRRLISLCGCASEQDVCSRFDRRMMGCNVCRTNIVASVSIYYVLATGCRCTHFNMQIFHLFLPAMDSIELPAIERIYIMNITNKS